MLPFEKVYTRQIPLYITRLIFSHRGKNDCRHPDWDKNKIASESIGCSIIDLFEELRKREIMRRVGRVPFETKPRYWISYTHKWEQSRKDTQHYRYYMKLSILNEYMCHFHKSDSDYCLFSILRYPGDVPTGRCVL